MRLPESLLGTLRVGVATTFAATALASIGCDAAAASSAGAFGTLPLAATAARTDALAIAPAPAPARSSVLELESRRITPVAPEPRVESRRAPEPIAAAEPAKRPKRARRAPVRAPEPEPKRWVCGPCGMG
jgi:hypothetical protein